jgi:hypothetical protein
MKNITLHSFWTTYGEDMETKDKFTLTECKFRVSIVHLLMILVLIYYSNKSTVAKVIALQIAHKSSLM